MPSADRGSVWIVDLGMAAKVSRYSCLPLHSYILFLAVLSSQNANQIRAKCDSGVTYVI